MPDLYSKKKGGGERRSSGIPGTLPRVRPFMEYSGSTLHCCEAFVNILDLMSLVFFGVIKSVLFSFLMAPASLIKPQLRSLIPTLRTLIG